METSPRQPDVIVERLTPEHLRSAYPLMREAAPTLSLPRWLNYARRISAGQGSGRTGIIVARRRGVTHLSGAVCYRRQRDLAHGPTLTAEHIVAIDLFYPEAILAALLAELELLAIRLGCTVIRSILRTEPPYVADEWHFAGHRAEGIAFTKVLATKAVKTPAA
jgi:hypothetical protein